ncbi:hypothetical protein EVAR_7903_1 [Eumeta japonica]|uniref:Uncharacterized protein n=1 Tax=Eumeta variegata TaxID=151549 RepID=A0A4C1TV82_EUMVA|nr:hypothetical protein EVAR_7903_1 [Eumeta japonica]
MLKQFGGVSFTDSKTAFFAIHIQRKNTFDTLPRVCHPATPAEMKESVLEGESGCQLMVYEWPIRGVTGARACRVLPRDAPLTPAASHCGAPCVSFRNPTKLALD